jgi:opacity protein-like surface antigen
MKHFFSAALLLMASMASKAQLDFSDLRVELAGNYTQYKGDFKESTPGVKLRVSVPVGERVRVGLGYTHGFPIKLPSSVSLSPSGSAPSEFSFNFKTISLEGNYLFTDEKPNGFTPYGTIGGALVLVSFQEKLKGSLPVGSTALDQAPKESVNGFTINLGLGAQYSFGKPKVFAEAGLALPSNQVNNQFVTNPIPFHLTFNLGVRFSFGSGDSDSKD